MLHLNVTLNGINYLLPDNSIPHLAEIEKDIRTKLKKLVEQFPDEEIYASWIEGKITFNAPPHVLAWASGQGNDTSV